MRPPQDVVVQLDGVGSCSGSLNPISRALSTPLNQCHGRWPSTSAGPMFAQAMQTTGTLWSPTPARIETSALRAYLDWLEEREGRPFPDHDALWAWSVEDLDRFWISIVDYYEVEFSDAVDAGAHRRPDAAHPLVHRGAAELGAARAAPRGGRRRRAGVRPGGWPPGTGDHLRRRCVARWRRRPGGCAGPGVRPGDRVGAYLPNTEHAVIGCLATAAVGAVWACCSPDFGADGTIGRLAQLEPTVLHRDGRLPLERQGHRPRRRRGAAARPAPDAAPRSCTSRTCSTGRTPRARPRGTS